MFFNNLGECESSFYLGECNNCNLCILSNKQDYLSLLINEREQELSDIARYNIDIDLKDIIINIIFLKHKLSIITKEINKIYQKKA